MLAMNPYDEVDLDAFRITRVGAMRGREVYRVILKGHKGFPTSVFRDHLVRTLFAYCRDDWHLGNDDRYIQFDVDDLCLAITARDADTLRSYGWL
jgi:hypothetical protein